VPEALPAMDDARRATRRLVGYVQRRCFEQTFASLGRDIGITDMTIRAMFGDLMEARRRLYRFETPRVLGIDEVKITGAYRLVLTNIERLAMYDMQPSRRMADMRAYFAAFPDRRKVEVFVADLRSNYETVHRTFFPHAALVADRFHVERMATNGMEAFRKAYRTSPTKAQRIRLKDERFLLLRAGRRPSERQRGALNDLFDRHPRMRAAWDAKEAFAGIHGAADRQEAAERLEAWPFSVPLDLRHHYREAINALRSRREHILNWHDHPVANGYTESINRLAKSINRMGRGYAFEVVRAKMLYDERAIEKGALVLRDGGRPVHGHGSGDLRLAHMMPAGGAIGMGVSPVPVPRRQTVRHGADIAALCDRLEAGAFEADAVGSTPEIGIADAPMACLNRSQ
jgi:transposase